MKNAFETTPLGDTNEPLGGGKIGHLQNDPLRRFLPTPYATVLSVMGRTVRLETNSPSLRRFMKDLFACYPRSASEAAVFVWRIVVESDPESLRGWPRRSGFSDSGLRYVEFGQRNFLASDLEMRQAIGIVSESLVKDPIGFTSPYLDNLLCLTAASLGLVPLWANCLVQDNRAVLLFGETHSGKTSASYIAEKLGLDFQGDEGAFLELDCGAVRGWGGFWPPTFRSEAFDFFPELKQCTRPLIHRDFVLHRLCGDRRLRRQSFQPHCCLFLERQSCADPVLSRIEAHGVNRLLAESILFRDDDRFAGQEAAVLDVLAELPAYRLQYADDPAVAALAARNLLTAPDLAAFDRKLPAAPSVEPHSPLTAPRDQGL